MPLRAHLRKCIVRDSGIMKQTQPNFPDEQGMGYLCITAQNRVIHAEGGVASLTGTNVAIGKATVRRP